MSESKHILVVGGAGYIGSHIVHDLCDAGHQVTIFDSLSTGLMENLDARAEFFHGDILLLSDLQKAFSKPVDVVFHFAALKAAGESMILPEKYSTNNITGTINLLNVMQEHAVKYFVFSSSAAVYGDPQYLPIDEKHPLQPINYYGYTKMVIEQVLHWYDQLKGLRYAALRYFNATGYDIKGRIRGKEKNPGNLSPIIMEVAAGTRPILRIFGDDYKTPDGTCIRDYIHVSDLADAHSLAMNYLLEKEKSLVVNLGTGHGYSVLEMLETARNISGLPIPHEIGPRRPGDPPELYANCQLANNLLQWKAKYSSVEQIIESMCRVYFK